MIKTQSVVVRGNLNALRYSNEILTPVYIPHLQNNGRMKLMHGGAPSHTARFTRALLEANRIKRTVMDISIARFKSDRAYLRCNWPKG